MSDEKKQKGLLKSLADLPFIKKLKNVKHIEIIVLVIFFLIMLLICFGSGGLTSSTSKVESISPSNSTTYITTKEYVNFLENKLTDTLSNMKDVGNVRVMISVNGSTEIVFATNQTTTSSGQSTETENKIVLVDSKPLIVSEKLPEINGVVIVSSGAKDTKVRLDIISAVQTLLNIEANKIQVFVGN